jgi:citrate synthase
MDTIKSIWWREEPLSEDDAGLLVAVLQAHVDSAFRNNASSMAVALTADSSQDMAKAIAAGLISLGERHAPLEQTFQFLSLSEPDQEVEPMLKTGRKIPGWGGTFQKDQSDPIWQGVNEILFSTHYALANKIAEVTAELHRCGKNIYANPSAYTAATAIALGLNAKSAIYLFIWGRIDAWAKIATNHMEVEKCPI